MYAMPFQLSDVIAIVRHLYYLDNSILQNRMAFL